MKKRYKTFAGLLAGLGGLAWYLRGWQAVSDVDCARLSAPVAGEEGPLNALDPQSLRRDTGALAAIVPRCAGTPGEAQARDWVTERFLQEGLARVRSEPFVYPRWLGEGARLTLLSTPAVELSCVALTGSSATPQAGIKAELVDVEAGGSVEAQAAGLVHLAWGDALSVRQICQSAARAGAAAVIVAHPQEDDDLAASGRWEAHDKLLVWNQIPALAVSHSAGLRLRQAATRGERVWLNVDCRYALGRGRNVVGEVAGSSKACVTLLAHYDARYSGAADSAAGVAALLALARIWRDARPKYTLRFMAVAAHQEGLMGVLTDVALRGLRVKRRYRGVVALSTLGAPGETLWAAGEPPQLRGAAIAIGRGLGYQPVTGAALGVCQDTVYESHWPYNQIQVPAVTLYKAPYRYQHTPYDLPDHLDYEDARWHTVIAGALVWRMAHTL